MTTNQDKLERLSALKATQKALNKKLNDSALFIGVNDSNLRQHIDIIPSGSLKLNRALGIGGWPKGRIVEIYGPESSGKTTLALLAIAECQKQNGIAAFVDVEHALDINYANTLGVNIDELLISQPSSAEQALEIVDFLVKQSASDIIVLDSVAALAPQKELEGEMGDAHVGLQARLMSQALRKLTGLAAQNNILIIFINQIRHKIGVMYGNPETTSGGNALKFYASVRVDVRKISNANEMSQGIAQTKAKVVKNKLAPPFQEATYTLLLGKGIDTNAELVDEAELLGVIDKAGSWYSYKAHKVQGLNSFSELLNSNPDLREQILNEINQRATEIRS